MPGFIMRAAGRVNVGLYRLSGGKLMGRLPSGAPVCVLTTTGRKSRRTRAVPLLYFEDGPHLVVVASQGGAPEHPAWYLNLQAEPRAEVEIGRCRFAVVAQRVDDSERARLWPRLLAMHPAYATYQRRTSRSIPVVRLSRSQ